MPIKYILNKKEGSFTIITDKKEITYRSIEPLFNSKFGQKLLLELDDKDIEKFKLITKEK